MTRRSQPLLEMLRSLIADRGLNTAALAQASDLDRARLRRVLSGSEDMTVEELLAITEALQLSPEELGLADVPSPEAAARGPVRVVEDDEDEDELGIDPWGNHPEQLFRVGFALGCDFFFLANADALQDSGVPQSVLSQYEGRDLPIKLDAAYHKYNQPRYGDDEVTLTLSFDALYDCTFPWEAIRQVIFFPAPPDPAEAPDEPDEDERPTLRLVT